MVIRFGYCPPNPGPKKKLKNKWFIKFEDAIDNWTGEEIWIKSSNSNYHKISYSQLVELFMKEKDPEEE